MLILGIETSCDETAAAVVKDGITVCSSVVSSSLQFHRKYGGIVPEIAFRKQLETIAEVVDAAFSDAACGLDDIGGIGVTEGPGLLGSLLVGISFARALALSRSFKLVGVDHLQSHIFANFLDRSRPRFPFIALIVSGGHTSLYRVRDFDDITVLGSTRDDACGEAFDKVAKILGLGYPGGPAIEQAARAGNPRAVRFACSQTRLPFDFSYSGIKTAVLYHARKALPELSPGAALSGSARQTRADICASFQEAALGVLVEKSLHACARYAVPRLVVGGGVAANGRLRDMFVRAASLRSVEVGFPEKRYCMDNAAMVAGLGYWLLRKTERFRPDSGLSVARKGGERC